MNNENWTDLPTIEAVAMAKGNGLEIEHRVKGDMIFVRWNGTYWSDNHVYRGRPARPKTKTMKFLAWMTDAGYLTFYSGCGDIPGTWNRIPSRDFEAEVEL